MLIFTGVILAESVIDDDKVVGLFLDGYKGSCKIIRGQDTIHDISQNENLYQGDLIVKEGGIDDLDIKFYPYARGEEIDSKTLKIVFEPRIEKEGLFTQVLSVLGFEKSRHQVYYAATRGILDLDYYSVLKGRGFFYSELPLERAAVFTDSKIRFRSPGLNNSYLYIIDSENNTILEQKVSALDNTYELSLANLSLTPGRCYTWRIGDAGGQGEFYVLESTTEASLKKALITSSNQEASIIRPDIQMVIYLKSVSSHLGIEYNLYTLCHQKLEDIVNEHDNLKREEMESIDLLLREIDEAFYLN